MESTPTAGAKALAQIDQHILPVVACMVHSDHTDEVWLVEGHLAYLRRQADAGSIESLWVLETIARLQILWIEATDRIAKAQEALAPTEGS